MNNKSKYFLLFLIFILLSLNVKSSVIDSLLNEIDIASDDSTKAVLYIELSDMYYPEEDENGMFIDSAFLYSQRSKNEYLIALVSFHKASNFNFYSEYDSAIVLLEFAIEVFEQYDDTLHSAASWGELGNSYCYQAIYNECLDCFLKSYQFALLLNNRMYIALVQNNIGNVYYFLDQKQKALKYFKEAYIIYSADSIQYGIALSSNNIGSVFLSDNMLDSALGYLKIAETVATKISYLEQLAETSANLATLYTDKGDFSLADEYSLKAISLNKQIGSYHGLAKSYYSYGVLLCNQKDYLKSKIFLDSAITLAVDVAVTEYEKESYLWLFKVDSALGNYHQALLSYLKYSDLSDSLADVEIEEKIANLESNFLLQIQEQENQLLEAQNKQQLAKINRQKLRSTFTTIALGLFVILVFLLFNIIRQRKKYNNRLSEKNSEITQQKEEILTQNEVLISKHKEIEIQQEFLQKYQQETQASINYALRIQIASLPELDNLLQIVNNLSLLYLPRDIISGDFYFYNKITDNKYAIAVADCTGHSVPGALMSILSIALLIEVTKENLNYTAAQIIGRVRGLLKQSLKQKWGTNSVLDGMDIAFVILDKQKNEFNFCGANRPLVYFRDSKMNIILGDRQPVSAYVVEKEFTDKYIKIQKDDVFYLFSDGYYDQLSENLNKFMLGRFKKILKKIYNLPLNDQKNILLNEFEDHKGNMRQTDDVTILTLKF